MQVFPYDVWATISCLLSPLDISAFERTCRDAWLLFQSRLIWLSVLNNFSIDCAPAFHFSRPASTLSLSELRVIAMRAQRAAITWTYADVIRHSHEVMVPLPQISIRPTFVKYVSGTTYAVAYSFEVGLMCIDVESGSCVWVGQHELFDLHHASTEVYVTTQMQSNGKLLICCCASNGPYQTSSVEIIQVNSDVQSSISVYSYSNGHGYDAPYSTFSAARMSAKFAVAFGFSLVLLVDWRLGRTVEIDVKNEILAVQISDGSIFILWINTNRQTYLSVVPICGLWSGNVTHRRTILWDIDAVLLMTIYSDFIIEAGVRMSLYKKESNEGFEPEAMLTIVSCGLLRDPVDLQLHFQAWRISIKEVFEGAEAPIVVSEESRKGYFLQAPGMQYLSIGTSGMTRSGRFVILTRDARRCRHFYGSSYARIAAGDFRLNPLELPYDGEEMSVDRLSIDEYSGDILWIYFCYTGFILTRFQ